MWDGPEWFDFKVCLGSIERYRRLSSLFVDILNVTDADDGDLLSNIRHIKTMGTYLTSTEEEMKITLLYEQLARECLDAEDITDSTKYVAR